MKSKYYFIRIIFIILYIALISFITFTSLQSDSSSGGFSYNIMSLISKITKIPLTDTFHYIIRKLIGHFGVNFVLGFISFFVYFSKKLNKSLIIHLTTGLALCIYNESLQLFTDGRNFSIIDILIDYSGFLVSTIIIYLIISFLNYRRRRINN